VLKKKQILIISIKTQTSTIPDLNISELSGARDICFAAVVVNIQQGFKRNKDESSAQI